MSDSILFGEDIVRALSGCWLSSQGGRGDRPEYWRGFDAALSSVAVALGVTDFECIILEVESQCDLGQVKFVAVGRELDSAYRGAT